MPRQDLIPLRRGTKASWESANPTLAEGEPGFETDTYTLKVGDGSTPYTTLPALNMGIQYYNAQVNGFNVSKDNNDIERKFWKDDFSVDSSINYPITNGTRIVDTTNKCLSISAIPGSFTQASVQCIKLPVGPGKIRYDVEIEHDTAFADTDYVYIELKKSAHMVFRWVYEPKSNRIVNQVNVNNSWAGVWLPCLAGSNEAEFIINPGGDCYTYVNGSLSYHGLNLDAESDDPWYLGVYQSGTRTDLTVKVSGLTYAPTESYADPFTTDTVSGANGRYQAVTGTVAYDDVNKRMNVTTATGANGKASGRLKSYKFTEGSQIFDVTLPTGADGDFITLVTHSANGLMTDGIGVGLQSDGAGNWNLATLSGTTVTEGADSGLDDADVARIEIEKDLTGQYWYYIYDAIGTKPTTATGKLFTTLTEGYTGWYANGAGAETQTFAIDNISIRAESIVGRTNVQVEEAGYFDRVEFDVDDSGRWRGSIANYTWDTANSCLKNTFANRSVWLMGSKHNLTELIATLKFPNGEATAGIKFQGDPYANHYTSYAGNDQKGYILRITGILVSVFRYNNLSTGSYTSLGAIGNIDTTIDVTATYQLKLAHDGNGTYTVSVSKNGAAYTVLGSVTDTTWSEGYVAVSSDSITSFEVHDLQISGTRVYNKPIHRGAQIGEFYDGSEEIASTTLSDNYNYNTIADYTGVTSSTVDTTNARLTLADTTYIYPTNPTFSEGFYKFGIMRSAASGSMDVHIAGHSINFNNDGAIAFDGGAAEAFTITAPSSRVDISILASGTSISIYESGALKGTKTGLTLSQSNFKMKMTTSNWYVYNLLICAESSFENGIAASISSISGGARFDTIETVGRVYDNSVQSGRYHLYTRYKATQTDATGTYLEAHLENTTDSSAILIGSADKYFALNLSTNPLEYLEEDIWLNYDDVGDEITINLERKAESTATMPTTYIDTLAIIPISEVQ